MKTKRGAKIMKKVRIVLAVVLAMSVFTFVGCGDNDNGTTDETTTVETTVETTTNEVESDAEDLKDDAESVVDKATETTK